jgi:hypothetical protein
MTTTRPTSPWIAALLGATLTLLAVLAFQPSAAQPGPLQAAMQSAEGSQTSSGFRVKKSTIGFAALGYVAEGTSQRIYVPGSDLEAMQLIPSVDGSEFWLELFYMNDDYALIKVRKLTMYRRYQNWTVSKVQTYLSGRADIAFPLVD